ncbi:hypothetical protein TWF694_006550 [Orbilia ellipsospora]|uniref:Uncharacterized protein n=1 Tax=Orbilia ellipsospora TaxID=2528407 RepID=A0AAV9XLU5_9PEZI
MQLKPLLFTPLLAATTASALPTNVDIDIAPRTLCTPQDNVGFTVRINSTDSLHDKILSISGSTVGVDLPSVDSVIWPYSDGKKIFMPGPGYKYLIPGYLYSDPSSSTTKQLKFSRDLPAVGTAETEVFSTSCDIRGQFYLAVGWDWSWKACPRGDGSGWTIHKEASGEGCRDVKLRMTYGPPY